MSAGARRIEVEVARVSWRKGEEMGEERRGEEMFTDPCSQDELSSWW
jgi:hypothetical protein